MNILIGADPELWIIDLETNKPISAEGLFEGTKAVPFKVKHGAVQVDGMAAEFNIQPAQNRDEFVFHIVSVLKDLRDIIAKNNPHLKFDFRFSPVADFGAEYIEAQPEHAKELGCTPDYNAHMDGLPNPTPDAEMPFRTASGHIHVGWGEDLDITDKEHIEACCMLSKQMDIYLGGQLAFYEGEEGLKRRELYGKAGAFRPKPYGVEYRTPSNVWLRSVVGMSKVYDSTKAAFNELIDGHRFYEAAVYYGYQDDINMFNRESLKRKFGNFGSNVPYGSISIHDLDGLYRIYEERVDMMNVAALPGIAAAEDDLDDDDIEFDPDFWDELEEEI